LLALYKTRDYPLDRPSGIFRHEPKTLSLLALGGLGLGLFVIAVLNDGGKLVMESIIETKASSILQFIHGLRGELHVTWEEGTWAAWLYDLLQPHVHQVLVCDPRRNALLKEGNKSDKIDAHKLADLLRTGMLRPVYHGEHGLRTLRELARSYQTISQDLNRVMNRIKALYRGWGIACGGFRGPQALLDT
jgi:hypothetical protein